GQKITHYIEAGGSFERACSQLEKSGFAVRYVELWGDEQHRREPRLRGGDHRVEEGRRDPAGARASTGKVPEQPPRVRPWQAQTPDPAETRLPVHEDGTGKDQRFRGDADVQEGP